MTPERQKWRDNLPKREKYLRREISYLQRKISTEKFNASITCCSTIKKIALKRINNYTAHIRALKNVNLVRWQSLKSARTLNH